MTFPTSALGSAGPLCGRALHTGATATAWLRPASRGLWFRRLDLRGAELPATLAQVDEAPRRTRLRAAGVVVETVEHVLAALAGLGHWHARVELDGAEPPILDGSALPWADALDVARWDPRAAGGCWRVRRVMELRAGVARCLLQPADRGSVECAIAFDHPAIGEQRARWQVGDGAAFRQDLAPARTFGFVAEQLTLATAGLARGAALDNVLVFDAQGPLGDLRFTDEPVRHKLLDAIGDLALLGAPLLGHLLLERASHALLARTLRRGIATGALEYEAAADQ